MPPPVSYITITNPPLKTLNLGFERVVTVAEFNVANEIWFRYDSGATPEAFGWFIGLSTGFSAATNLYQSDGTTLVNGNTGANSLWWPIAAASTYYIRIRNNLGGGIGVAFNCLFEGTDIGLTTVPDGSWLVNDDSTYTGTTGMPSAVYSPSGAFIGFISTIPAGEIGDTLPDKTSLWHDRFGMYGGELVLFNSSFAFVSAITPVPSLGAPFPCISNDGTKFFVLNRNTNDVFTVSATGVVSGIIQTLTFVRFIKSLGVSRDGLILYYAEGDDRGEITKAVVGGAESVFYTIPGFQVNIDYIALTAVNNHPGEIIVLQDGTIATWWHDFSAGEGHILHLSAAGALLHDIVFNDGSFGLIDHIHYSPNGAGSVYAWFFTNGSANVGKFGLVTWATGTFSELFTTNLYSLGETLAPTQGQILGPSASCSMVTLGYPGSSSPPVNAQITVTKVVTSSDPDDNLIDFQFTAVGMSPISFTLKNGQSITFTGLPNGTYSVVETTEAGFITTYTVSNGNNNTNIILVAGDAVTVTVLNVATLYSGIYKIQPEKRNDTLWTNVLTNATVDVKIPNPRIRTALIGK